MKPPNFKFAPSRLIFVSLIILCISLLTTHGLHSQMVFIESQSDVDNFASTYPGITEFVSIKISGEDITNLNGLSQVKRIDHNLTIKLTSLENLEGLNNLEIINPDSSIYSRALSITLNDKLTSLDGLENLNIPRTSGAIFIGYNKNLESCSQQFICDFLIEREYIIIFNNGIQCSENHLLTSNCGIEYDNSKKSIFLEDGFENWNDSLPMSFQMLWAVWSFEIPTITKVNSITEGNFAISMRNLKPIWDYEYHSGDIITKFSGTSKKLNIEFDCICEGEGLCEIFLIKYEKDNPVRYIKNLWSIKGRDSTIYSLQFQDVNPNNNFDEIAGIGFRSRSIGIPPIDTTEFIIDNFKVYIEKTSNTTMPHLETRVFPNPTSDFVNIELPNEKTTYDLFNSSGTLLLKSHEKPIIDLSTYPDGIYFLRYNDGVSPYSIKIIKN